MNLYPNVLDVVRTTCYFHGLRLHPGVWARVVTEIRRRSPQTNDELIDALEAALIQPTYHDLDEAMSGPA